MISTKTITVVVETELSHAEIRRRIKKGWGLLVDSPDGHDLVSIGDIQRFVGIDRHETGAPRTERKSRAKKGRTPK